MDEVTNYELAKVYEYLNDLDKDIKQLRDEIKALKAEKDAEATMKMMDTPDWR